MEEREKELVAFRRLKRKKTFSIWCSEMQGARCLDKPYKCLNLILIAERKLGLVSGAKLKEKKPNGKFRNEQNRKLIRNSA